MPTWFNVFQLLVYIFCFVIFSAALVETVAPKWVWRKFLSWKATKEPSNAYFLMARITGVFVMIVIAIFAFGPTIIAILDK